MSTGDCLIATCGSVLWLTSRSAAAARSANAAAAATCQSLPQVVMEAQVATRHPPNDDDYVVSEIKKYFLTLKFDFFCWPSNAHQTFKVSST